MARGRRIFGERHQPAMSGHMRAGKQGAPSAAQHQHAPVTCSCGNGTAEIHSGNRDGNSSTPRTASQGNQARCAPAGRRRRRRQVARLSARNQQHNATAPHSTLFVHLARC
eukprot:7214151-Alexandrium_andersonii.AAC.1